MILIPISILWGTAINSNRKRAIDREGSYRSLGSASVSICLVSMWRKRIGRAASLPSIQRRQWQGPQSLLHHGLWRTADDHQERRVRRYRRPLRLRYMRPWCGIPSYVQRPRERPLLNSVLGRKHRSLQLGYKDEGFIGCVSKYKCPGMAPLYRVYHAHATASIRCIPGKKTKLSREDTRMRALLRGFSAPKLSQRDHFAE